MPSPPDKLDSTLLDAIGIGVSLSSEDGIIVYTNAAEDGLFGYAPGELLGQHVTVQNAYPPEVNERVVGEVIATLRDQQSWRGHWRNRRKDGSEFTTASEIRAVEINGERYWLCTQSEVVGAGLVENERLASERRLAAILETALDCIITIDDQSRIVEWNAACEKVFGLPREGVLGADLAQLIIPPEYRERHHRGMERYLRTGEGPVLRRRVELEALRADGSRFPVELAIVPLELGSVRYFTAYLRDVSERKRAEDQRRLLTNELNHRIRNTLATVQAISAQTLGQSGVDSSVQEALAGRLQSLAKAHDLLTKENWVGGDITDITSALTETHAISVARFQAVGPKCVLTPQCTLSLSLALHELVTNATKYGALSAPSGVIELRWELEGNAGERRLVLHWLERDGPEVMPPSRKGFGSRLLDRALAAELGGSVDLAFRRSGLECRIRIPVPG